MAFDPSKFGAVPVSTSTAGFDPSKFGASVAADAGEASQDPTRGSSTGIFTGPLSVLAAPGQLLGKIAGQRATAPSQSKVLDNNELLRKMLENALLESERAISPTKKKQWLQIAQDAAKSMGASSKMLNDIQNGIREKQRIETPIGTIPALSDELGRNLEQISGRGIQAAALTGGKLLGATGSGALLGAGSALEEGASPTEIAVRSAEYAAGGKILGTTLGAVSKTGVGQRVINSPVVRGASKLLDPLAARSAEGGLGMTVDKGFEAFGKLADKLYSPTTYLRPAAKILQTTGEKVGVIKTMDQKVGAAKEKLYSQWENVRMQTKKTFKYADSSISKTLADEGLSWERKGESMFTGTQQEILRLKIQGEGKLLGNLLDKSGAYASLEDAKAAAVANINKQFRGVEREQALKLFERQFEALVGEESASVVIAENGDRIIPANKLNSIKSYFWDQGYSSKLAPKSEQVASRAMRSAGNGLKTTIEKSVGASNYEAKEALIALNKRLGRLSEAERFLREVNGNKLPFGRVGKYFAGTIGAVIGSAGGPIGSTAGVITAEQLIDVYTNPKYSVGKAAQIIAQARKTAPQEVERAMQILKSIEEMQASQLALPAPSYIVGQPYKGGVSGPVNPRVAESFASERKAVAAQNSKDVFNFSREKELQARAELKDLIIENEKRSDLEKLVTRFKSKESWLRFTQSNPLLRKKIMNITKGLDAASFWDRNM